MYNMQRGLTFLNTIHGIHVAYIKHLSNVGPSLSCDHSLPHTRQSMSSKLGVYNSEPLTPEAANPLLLLLCVCVSVYVRPQCHWFNAQVKHEGRSHNGNTHRDKYKATAMNEKCLSGSQNLKQNPPAETQWHYTCLVTWWERATMGGNA